MFLHEKKRLRGNNNGLILAQYTILSTYRVQYQNEHGLLLVMIGTEVYEFIPLHAIT